MGLVTFMLYGNAMLAMVMAAAMLLNLLVPHGRLSTRPSLITRSWATTRPSAPHVLTHLHHRFHGLLHLPGPGDAGAAVKLRCQA
jgi:hypothetical protein